VIEALHQKILHVQSQDELDIIIKALAMQPVLDSFEKSDSPFKQAFTAAIVEKIIHLIFAQGQICSRDYLYLYGYFIGLQSTISNPTLEGYIALADDTLSKKALPITEKILWIELKFIAQILAYNAQSGYEAYIDAIIKCEIHDLKDLGSLGFTEAFLKHYPVDIESYLHILEKNLQKEYYFSLDFIQRRSLFVWSYHVFWNQPGFYTHTAWRTMYPYWKAIYDEHLSRGELDEAMYVQFYITIKMGSGFQTTQEWNDFQKEILEPIIPHYMYRAKKLPKCKKEMTKKGRKIIGVLKERAIANSPFKVEYSLWKSLMEDEAFTNNYEIRIYTMGYVEQSLDEPTVVEAYKAIHLKYIDVVTPVIRQKGFYHSHLEKALVLRKKNHRRWC